ncbi:MAG: hypothetical protein ACLQGP_38625 [Isosphaeraceae bacterium]
MKHRLFDGFLIIVAVIGGVLAFQSGRERSRLTERHARLARTAGELPIADPFKVYMRALDTGEPLHFAWRVYCPPNYNNMLYSSTGSGDSTWGSSRSSEFIARVRFREDAEGVVDVYSHFGSGSTAENLGDKGLADLLRNRWDRVRVEQLGAPEVIVLEPDQSAVMLRLTLPDDMKAEAGKALSPNIQEKFFPVLFELDLGSRP